MENEFEIIEIPSFNKLSNIDFSLIGKKLIAIDIRKITKKEQKKRLLDFITGLSLGRECTISRINKEGVYLLKPKEFPFLKMKKSSN